MKPGATTRPSASIVRDAESRSLPIATIFPLVTATSPRKAGMPEPSMTRPFLIRRSYAILCSFWGCGAGRWASARRVVRGEPPRFHMGPHLRQHIHRRDERLDLLRGIGQEESLDRAQHAPQPDLMQDGLQALWGTVRLGQQHELRLVDVRQVERLRNDRALLGRHRPLPP